MVTMLAFMQLTWVQSPASHVVPTALSGVILRADPGVNPKFHWACSPPPKMNKIPQKTKY